MRRLTLFATVCAFGLVGPASAARIQFEASLDGKSEVPGKASDGSGQALVTLDTTAKAGANAGVVVPIGGKGPESPVSGTATLTDAQIKDLESGQWYVNVHTAANPGGEIRGQVLRSDGAMPKMGHKAMMQDGHGAMPMKH